MNDKAIKKSLVAIKSVIPDAGAAVIELVEKYLKAEMPEKKAWMQGYGNPDYEIGRNKGIDECKLASLKETP